MFDTMFSEVAGSWRTHAIALIRIEQRVCSWHALVPVTRIDNRRWRAGKPHHAAAILALAAAACAWWWPLLAGFLPDFMDTVAYLYPIRMALARQITGGTLPVWLPNLFAGIPLAANPQLATWYPPQALFYLAPGAFSYGLLAVAHYVLGAAGMYVLVWRLTRNGWAAFFSALIFEFGPMMVGRLALLPHVYSAAWIPWLLLCVEMLTDGRSRNAARQAVLLGLAAAMQFLAGAPQISYYTAVCLGIVWAVRVVQPGRRGGTSLGSHLLQTIAWTGAAGAIAYLVSGIQLVPAQELASRGRGAIDSEQLTVQALNGSMLWKALVGFTGKGIEDTDSINAIGIGALLLCGLALACRSGRRRAMPYLAAGLVGWLLAAGPVVKVWANVLPIYDHFHAPRRALMLWSVCGCVAAGVGAAALGAMMRRRRWPAAAFPVALVGLACGTAWIMPRVEREFVRPQRLDAAPETIRHIGSHRFISVDPTFNYSYDSRREDFGRSLIPNLAALRDLHDAQGYDPVVPPRYATACALACASSGRFWPSHGAFFTDPNSPVLRLLGVQYLVGRWDLLDPGRMIPGTRVDHKALGASLKRITDDPRWPLYRYREQRPLAWVPADVQAVPHAAAALQAAVQGDPYRVAFTEEPTCLSRQANSTASLHWTSPRTAHIELALPAAVPRLVCVSVAWDPDWIARGPDGRLLAVQPVDGVIAGVIAPAGARNFDLRYEPASLVHGAGRTAAGILLATLLLFLRRRRVAVR